METEKPWQDQVVKKKESGKDELSVKDMSAQSGIDENQIRTLIKQQRIQPMHYKKGYAVDGVILDAQMQAKVEANVHALTEKSRGVPVGDKPKRIRDMATSMVINDARLEGRPVHFKYKEKSAEEVFQNRLNSPFGKAMFDNPKFRKETQNMEAGGEWFDGPKGIITMPENYDQVLWSKTREEAARLNVLAITGDEEAAKKYRILQSKFPDQLPTLESKIEPPKDDRALREKR